MIGGSGGNWTALTIDKVFSFLLTKTSRSSQLLEDTDGSINSLLAGLSFKLAQMFPRHGPPSSAHSGAQVSRLNLPGEYRHEKRDQSPVCFRKELFSFRTKSVRGVRFANAAFEPGLCHESVALKAGKVRPHSVISQIQFFSELVYSAFSCAQKLEDFPSGAFEQPLPPAYMFHYTKDHGDSD